VVSDRYHNFYSLVMIFLTYLLFFFQLHNTNLVFMLLCGFILFVPCYKEQRKKKHNKTEHNNKIHQRLNNKHRISNIKTHTVDYRWQIEIKKDKNITVFLSIRVEL